MSIGEGRQFFILIDGMLTEVLTCRQAAYHYNFTIRTIQKWIDEGKISAIEIEHRFWIPKKEIEAFAKANDYNPKLMAE